MNTSNDWNELNGTETTGGRGEDVLIVWMRRTLAIGLATLALLASSASARADEPLSPIVPFVIPNGKPTEAEIREIVRTLHANGYDQFMPYPSTGLDYDYLGEDFFRMMGWFLDEARRLGLKVWLYDEFNWPSGTARGRVPAENENCLYRELVAVTNAAGDVSWQFLVSREMNVDNYCLDTNNLEPESAERFLDLTHRAYARRFGSDMGTVIRGFFTDEPGHCSSAWRLKRPKKEVLALPCWSSMEDDYASATGGRSFRADCQEEFRKGTLATGEVLRVWTALRSMRYRQSYFDRIAAFCTSNGLVSTGHLVSEDYPVGCARVNGLPLRTLKGLTKPGIDLIFSNVGPHYEWLTLALGQSAAWHRGRPGSAELFGLGPCDITFAMMRRQYWLAALFGIDTYFQALYHQRATRFEFKDSWAMFTSPAQPWFGESALLHAEARKAAAWASKPQVCALAVVYPQRTFGACALAKSPAPDLAGLCRLLSWNGFNYLLIEEDEPTRLPHVLDWQGTNLVDRATGARLAVGEEAVAWAERRLGRRRTPGRIVRDYLDGSRVTVDVAACSVTIETKDGRQSDTPSPASACRDLRPDAADGWRLKLDGPSRRRVWFWTSNVGFVANMPWEMGPKAKAGNQRRDQPDNSAKVALETDLKGIRFVLRTVGKERLSVTLDGQPLDFSEPATSLVYSFNEICRETKPMDLAAGEHLLVLSGGRDGKMFYPVLWMVGDFAERVPGRLSAVPTHVGTGSLAEQGLGSFAGTATYIAETAFAHGESLSVDGGGAVVRVRYGGRDLGVRGWAPFVWDIPQDLVGRRLPLEIDVITSVRPIFGSDKSPDACLNHSLWVESALADPSPVGLRHVRIERHD